jgi:hypothetical protein
VSRRPHVAGLNFIEFRKKSIASHPGECRGDKRQPIAVN